MQSATRSTHLRAISHAVMLICLFGGGVVVADDETPDLAPLATSSAQVVEVRGQRGDDERLAP
ncbi:MAG: hypothetical protein RR763_19315, partial [Massilia sp.]